MSQRGANLLSCRRATALLAALAAVNFAFAAAIIVPSYVTLTVPGQIPDFAAFWAAGRLTLDGPPALAYDWEVHRAAELAGLGRDFTGWMPWHYPPHVQYLLSPLGVLPLFPAMALWTGGTLALFLWTCWRILPRAGAVLAGLAAAPTMLTLVNGQIGFLMAALIGLALLDIDRRPVRAGLLLGLLSFKPHLVAAVPLPLIAAGRWRTVLGGAACMLALAALTFGALKGETWTAFITSITQIGGVFAGEAGKFTMYASPYGALRLAGVPFTAAVALHATAALAVLILTVRAWRAPSAPDVNAALICYATLAVTPRVLNYDLHILVIGALFQCRHALAHGFFRGEQLMLAATALAAFVSVLAAPGFNPVLALALFASCWLGHARRPR